MQKLTLISIIVCVKRAHFYHGLVGLHGKMAAVVLEIGDVALLLKGLFDKIQAQLESWLDILEDRERTPTWRRWLVTPFLQVLWYYVIALCNPLGLLLVVLISLGVWLDFLHG